MKKTLTCSKQSDGETAKYSAALSKGHMSRAPLLQRKTARLAISLELSRQGKLWNR